jgi:hypothetical protein
MKRPGDMYYTIVVENVSKQILVGTATLLVEKKFVRSAGKVSCNCGQV